MTTNSTTPSKYSWKAVTICIILIGLITYLFFQLLDAKNGHTNELAQLQIQLSKQTEAQNKLNMELNNPQKELGGYLPYMNVDIINIFSIINLAKITTSNDYNYLGI